MTYTPVTPFRRAVSAAHVKQLAQNTAPPPARPVNKWEVLRELATARPAFGLSDRDLTVLQALVSFHPGNDLEPGAKTLTVHPSNKAICERLNGMPCSTMRRHLARLVDAGFVTRRDSPNGKRYVRRYGKERVVYGFDLTPLLARHSEVCAEAEAIREAEDAYRRLRERVSLMRRDLAGLAEYGAETRPDLSLWRRLGEFAAQCARDLRRKLSASTLAELATELLKALKSARDVLEPSQNEEMSTSDAETEHHCQNSNTDSYDSELCPEETKGEEAVCDAPGLEPVPDPAPPRIPLAVVLNACPEIQSFAPDPVRHWHQLVAISETLRPMLGISGSAWQEARTSMGPEQAAVVLAAMLERIGEIKSPGGYLRHLSRKAEAGQFSCGPMVMSLLRKTAA